MREERKRKELTYVIRHYVIPMHFQSKTFFQRRFDSLKSFSDSGFSIWYRSHTYVCVRVRVRVRVRMRVQVLLNRCQ